MIDLFKEILELGGQLIEISINVNRNDGCYDRFSSM